MDSPIEVRSIYAGSDEDLQNDLNEMVNNGYSIVSMRPLNDSRYQVIVKRNDTLAKDA